MSIVPKPRNITAKGGPPLSLSSLKFQFAAKGKVDSPLLRAAFKRYAAILTAHHSSGSSLNDKRSLDWLLSSSLLSPSEHAALASRIADRTNASGSALLTADATGGMIVGADVYVEHADAIKTLSTDESYSLTIAAPRITIRAATVYGAMYAMESLVQLVDGAKVNATVVDDEPRFAFRATMIDTARHWYPLPAIKQHLDSMAAVKMNVLHWHLVDSQSFPFVSTHLPVMSATGAWQPDHVYTPVRAPGCLQGCSQAAAP